MKRILIVGRFGNGSIGDEAVLASAIQQTRAADERVEITAISENPKHTEAIHRIEACSWSAHCSICARVPQSGTLAGHSTSLR